MKQLFVLQQDNDRSHSSSNPPNRVELTGSILRIVGKRSVGQSLSITGDENRFEYNRQLICYSQIYDGRQTSAIGFAFKAFAA